MIRVYRFDEVSWADNETEVRLTTELANAMLEVNRLTQELAAHRRKIDFMVSHGEFARLDPFHTEQWRTLSEEKKTELWNKYLEAILKNSDIPF